MFLRAVEPDSIEDREALVQMRIACGWHSHHVPIWLENIRAGKLLVWFICEPSTGATSD
ncbi:16522_t:CDS:1, partial [Acaulospora colombiana]